jgi:beta-N-acetylhexosaminidase
MKIESMPLVVGVPSTVLGAEERRILEKVQPAGVILFARNVETAEQTRELVASLGNLEPRPFVAVDLEGGIVNRLSALWGELPTPAQAGAAGRRAVRALGEAAGAACCSLGIQLDLAPVVDLEHPDGLLHRQGRCFSDNPERVVVLARIFNEGLAEWGVTGCLKHFPGLGAVPTDTHEELPILEPDEEEIERHLGVFKALAPEIPVVMVGHVVIPALGDAERPASLSRTVVDRAVGLPGAPVILSDDLEMGALDGWGDLPERVEAALRARNHGVLVCKAFDRLEEIAAHLTERSAFDSALGTRLTEMAARMGTLRRDLCQRRAAVPAPDDTTIAQLWEHARREAAQ